MKMNERRIVIINQAVNYLTVGICNEFAKEFAKVSLITGSIHEQGERLHNQVTVDNICKWKEEHGFRKALIYLKATLQIWWLLITKYRKYEVLFISLPPMGYLINLIVRNKFSMLLWDVYPDVFTVTGMKKSHLLYKTWAYLNKKSFRKAHKIFTIGENIRESLAQYVSKERIIISPIWSIFQSGVRIPKSENIFIKSHHLQNKFIIQYSGNIGLTHNVEVLIEIAKKMQEYDDILFQIVGRGPRKRALEKIVSEEKMQNCQFLPFQSDDMFPFSLAAANIGVVILDEKASKGSVPSKSYNLMSYGIPSLYIASKDSELNIYANNYKHALCFSADQYDEIKTYILKLKQDEEYYSLLAKNSLIAANNFRRVNAKKLVEKYI